MNQLARNLVTASLFCSSSSAWSADDVKELAKVGRKQDCFLISGVVSIVPLWRDKQVPLSRAQANIDNILAQTGTTESERKEWHQLVSGIYSSRITSSEVEQQLRPACLTMDNATSKSQGGATTSHKISTYTNGQLVGVRNVTRDELTSAATALTEVFGEKNPDYENLVKAAQATTAQGRCFNLFSARFALASIDIGKIDASSNAQTSLRSSTKSLEAENQKTQVTCEIR